jgi:hypothetical protein
MVWYLCNSRMQILKTENMKFHPPLNSFLRHYIPVGILKAIFSEIIFDKFYIFQLSESRVTRMPQCLMDLQHQSLVFLLCNPRSHTYVQF